MKPRELLNLAKAPLRRAGSWAGLALVALVGLVLGLMLLGRTSTDVGPFTASMSVSPSLYGDTEVQIPPLGALELDTHEGPAHLQVRLDSLDQARTQALITDPTTISQASQTAVTDVREGITRLVLRSTSVAVLAAMGLAALIYRRAQRVAVAGGIALAVMLSSFGLALGTFNPRALQEPRYEGLLANAPAVVGDAQRLADRYDEYAGQLQKLVQNVGNLYATVSNLPLYSPDDGTLRVLHVSDLHLNPAAWSVIRTVVENFNIDLVIDTGDINDWGSETESSFVASIALLRVPYVYVRGNHDSGITQAAVASQPNAIVLDNRILTVNGLTIGGIGDPRFTPDKETSPAGSGESKVTIERVQEAGETLADTIDAYGKPVDIALVHDPASAGALAGTVPLVLAGHRHERSFGPLGDGPTQLMVQGSTGGAGLRGLEGEAPKSLEMSVLYFNPAHQLQAYDDITVGGTGLAEVSLSRHVITDPALAQLTSPSPAPTQ